MVLKKVGVVGTASAADVLSGETFTSETEGGEATGSMPNRGVGDIDGPNDELSGAGYYSRIDNNIPDRGSATISSPGGNLSGGYYSAIYNNITNRGDIDNISVGDYNYSGYYSSGTVNMPNTPSVVFSQDSPTVLGPDVTNTNSFPTTTGTVSYDINQAGSIQIKEGAVFSKKVDVSGFSQLEFDWEYNIGRQNSNDSWAAYVGINNTNNEPTFSTNWEYNDIDKFTKTAGVGVSEDYNHNTSGQRVDTIDISGLSGEYYIAFLGMSNHDFNPRTTVYSIKFLV